MLLQTKIFKTIHFKTIDSTNNYAKNLSKDSNIYAIIISDTQTAGRSTKKQGWISPKGNLYFSIIFPLKNEKNLSQYSFLTALSIVESIKSIDKNENNIKIKWPNDILLNKQKISGILIEKENNSIIIGIGINIISSPDSSLTRYPTTNLITNKIKTTPVKLANIILENLIKNINIKETQGFKEIINKITQYLFKFKDTIYINTANEILTGIFDGLDRNGALLLKTKDKTYTLISGEMTKENFI